MIIVLELGGYLLEQPILSRRLSLLDSVLLIPSAVGFVVYRVGHKLKVFKTSFCHGILAA